MTKRVQRAANRAASYDVLVERVDYISDPDHEHHKGKEILPARNYGCPDQSKEAFIKLSERLHFDYKEFRYLKTGKQTGRLFDEIIYSSENGAHLTDKERDKIETGLVKKFGRNAAVRTAWHIDTTTGRADLHILISGKNKKHEVVFGQAIGNSIVAFQTQDRKIAALLNANPERRKTHTAAIDVRIAKTLKKYKAKRPATLAEQIAMRFRQEVTAENLKIVLGKLGHSVKKITAKAVHVIFKKCFNTRTIPLRELLLSIGEAQIVNLKRRKARKLAILAEEIAKICRAEITAANLASVLVDLGHTVEKMTEVTVFIRLKNLRRARPIALHQLLPAISKAQMATREPTTGKPPTEKPAIEKATTEKTTTGKATTEKTTTGKATTEKTTTGKATTEKTTTEKATTGKPTTGKPTTGKPTKKPTKKPCILPAPPPIEM